MGASVYDFVVIGGGMAGVCAAIAAARRGCHTALVHDRPVLGGNASSEIRMHICGADAIVDGQSRRETGIIEEIRLAELCRNTQRSPSMSDLILYEWCKREPNLDLFLNTLALEPIMNGTQIASVRTRQLASEQEHVLSARVFADCSGDGQIGAQSGADHRRGRESVEEYGESLAVSQADAFTLGSSLLFMARDMGRPVPFEKPDWACSFPTDTSLQHREHGCYRYGYWWIEWGGIRDTIRDNDRIRHELLRILLGVWDHIKNHGDHGADNWGLEWIGMLPGKRESRRFIGDYVLRQSDLENGRIFDDEVAYGGWPIDIHPIQGIHSHEEPCKQIAVPLYSIPLRSLYSRNIDNLFLAGRNISATHVAFASTRVMGTAAVMGQAVGTAAAFCCKHNQTPRQSAQNGISQIQQWLLQDGCHLLGHRHNDSQDLSQTASVTACGSASGTAPEKVIDGFTRPVVGDEHVWESLPLAEGGRWLELSWRSPQAIRLLQITFDTELEKRLLLTQDETLYRVLSLLDQVPGRLVKDFEVQLFHGQQCRSVSAVNRNIQRQVRLAFDPCVTIDRLRIRFTATHGHPGARVFEVRVY